MTSQLGTLSKDCFCVLSVGLIAAFIDQISSLWLLGWKMMVIILDSHTRMHTHTHSHTRAVLFNPPIAVVQTSTTSCWDASVDSSSLCSSSWTSEPWEILALHWLLITLRTWSQPFTSIQRPFMSSVSISSCSFPTSSSSYLRLHATALLNYLSRALPLMGPRINASLWQEHSSLPSFLILSSLSAYFFIVRLRVSTWTWQPSGGIHRQRILRKLLVWEFP